MTQTSWVRFLHPHVWWLFRVLDTVVDTRPEGRFRVLDPEARDSELSKVCCFTV